MAELSLPFWVCAPASLTSSLLWGSVGVTLLFGRERSLGSRWKPVFCLKLCLIVYLGAIAAPEVV